MNRYAIYGTETTSASPNGQRWSAEAAQGPWCVFDTVETAFVAGPFARKDDAEWEWRKLCTRVPADAIPASELRLGDTVRLMEEAPFMDAVVLQIADGNVHLERPYLLVSDFTSTAGVGVTIGHENFTVPIDSAKTYRVLARRALR